MQANGNSDEHHSVSDDGRYVAFDSWATNLVSGLAEALGSSVPVIALVADIRRERSHLRRRSVTSQALEQDDLLAAVSKWVARVETPELIGR